MEGTKRAIVLFRGAGDLATGCIARLSAAGFLVAALEIERPTAIRRAVALSDCMYEGEVSVEGIAARRVDSPEAPLAAVAPGLVPVLADPACASLAAIEPAALVDAILAKRNLGTRIDMAPIVVALGPGFRAGVDAHAVVETNRGHNLGRVLLAGEAEPDTGTPGVIGGFGAERVVKSPIAGAVEPLRAIGDIVERGDPILAMRGAGGRVVVSSGIAGVVRGMIRPGTIVPAGLKIADVDPRAAAWHCASVSDKARAVGGGVLEAVMRFGGRPR